MKQASFDLTLEGVAHVPNGNSIGKVHSFSTQLLKWVGNKQRFAHEIISFFPSKFGCYWEPFLGSGAVLGTLAPKTAVGSDMFEPLIKIFATVKDNPSLAVKWYSDRWHFAKEVGKREAYEEIKARYNKGFDAADFLYLTRSCYGGVVRFRQADGYMSTPCGVHEPITPSSFEKRVRIWNERIRFSKFEHGDYKQAFRKSQAGDLIYCDPPYSFSQAILYGAQSFRLDELFEEISVAKKRGIFVVLSIDGSKKSGDYLCDIKIPDGVFSRELEVNIGRSMLKRFQMSGQTLEDEIVKDRLLLTY